MSDTKKNAAEKTKKTATEEYIDKAAEMGARKALLMQHGKSGVNHYRAMENLLFAYPRRVRIMEHPEEFHFFKVERSKDISIAPPPGTGVVDKIESAEMYTEARKQQYQYEMRLLCETEYAIASFKDLPEFVVIRMYYFNENYDGTFRGLYAKRMTFEEIAEELENTAGIQRSVATIRKWRSQLVRDMTVMMFGADGALSVESHDNIRNNKIKREEAKENEVGKTAESGQVHSQGQ